MGNNPDFIVRVYRDHPEWGNVDRWFRMDPALLRDLFVVDYIFPRDESGFINAVTPENDLIQNAREAVTYVRGRHPGPFVFVHLPVEHA